MREKYRHILRLHHLAHGHELGWEYGVLKGKDLSRAWVLSNEARSSWTRIRIITVVFGRSAPSERTVTATDVALEMGSRVSPVRRETIQPYSDEACHVVPVIITGQDIEKNEGHGLLQDSLIPVLPVREEGFRFIGGLAELCAKHDSVPECDKDASSNSNRTSKERRKSIGDLVFCEEEADRCTRGEMEGYRYIPGTGYRWM